MLLVSREEAKVLGLKKYYTGKSCKNNHISERYVATSRCYKCESLRNSKYIQLNKNRILISKKEHYYANRDNSIARSKKWNIENKERYHENVKRWKAENPEQNKIIEKRSKDNHRNRVQNDSEYRNYVACRVHNWRRQNKDKVNKKVADRKAQKLRATPVWANNDKILLVYRECSRLNILHNISNKVDGFVVDHIIPLQGENICGLHVETNLRIISFRENSIKRNKLIEELL